MKKLILSAAVLLLCSWVILLCSGIGMPHTEALAAACEADNGDQLYLAENRIQHSRIYTADSSGKITRVYRENRRNGAHFGEIAQLAAAPKGVYFIRNIWEDDALYPENWELCLLENGKTTSLGGGKDVADMRVTDLGVYHGEIKVAGITPSGSAVLCTLPENGKEWSVGKESKRDALKAAATDRGLVVMFENGKTAFCDNGSELPLSSYPDDVSVEDISVEFMARIQCKAAYFAIIAVMVFIVTALAAALILCLKARTVVNRTTLVIGIFLFFAFILVGSTLCIAGVGQRSRQTLGQAIYHTQSSARTISGSDANSVLSDDFIDSAERYSMKESVDPVCDTVIALRGSGAVVVLSGEYPYGTSAQSALSSKETAIVNSAIKGDAEGFTTRESGRRISVCAAPINSNGITVAVLLSRIPADIGYESVMEFAKPIAAILCLMYVATMLVANLFLRYALSPVAELTKQMRDVSDGKLAANEIIGRNDELGQLHDAMQEMCAGLSIRDYEVNSIIRSYKRFIPTGLHQLLDRASVMEVSFSDSNSLTGCVSLYSVNNREAARSAMNDDAFVDFVSDCFSSLYDQVTAHRGQMLANGFDLNSIPVYYPIKPIDALNAGLGLIGETERKGSDISPDYFQMLHHTTFMYGIAGVEDRVFPFFSSGEIEFLNDYSDKFHALGVPMVATDAYMKHTDGLHGRSRYIGFVNSADGKYSYKLYEMLDAYSDVERARRVRYDQQFQDAIRLFYSSDFYLARNQFSTLLKNCPNDGIARWYLFACEQAFNSDADKIDYQLFGIQ